MKKYNVHTEQITVTDYEIETQNLKDLVDASCLTEGDTLQVLKMTKTMTKSGVQEANTKEVKSHIVSPTTVEKIVATPYLVDDIVKTSGDPSVFIKTKGFWEHFKSYGFDKSLREFAGVEEIPELKTKDFASAIRSGKAEVLEYVINPNHLQVIKNTQNQLATTPIFLDYIRANLDNEKYDLDAVVEHLMTQERVGFFTERARYHTGRELLNCPLTGQEPEIGYIIEDIPGYNATETQTECINVIYYPTTEELKKIMNWELTPEYKKAKMFSYQDYIVRDILGCEKFLLAPPELENEEPVIKRKFKR